MQSILQHICRIKQEEHDVAPLNSYFLKVAFEIQQMDEVEINTILTHDQQIMN